jgi:hypothetical protein
MASRAAEPEVPFRAFSGANIYASIGNSRIGTLQAVTVSVTREVAALYSFSDANPKAFVKGKRGIAGTLVFTQFDRHALLQDIFKESFDKPLSDSNALFSSRFLENSVNRGILNQQAFRTRNFENANIVGDVADSLFDGGVAEEIQTELESVYDLVRKQRLRYADQIPEFDITITMVNEAGDAAFCVIGGIVLVNEGWGYTLDDLVSEVAYTYVARGITPLTAITDNRVPAGHKGFSSGTQSSGRQSILSA